MMQITISGLAECDRIIDLLATMPMTRKFGKGLIAKVTTAPINPEKCAAIYMRVSGAKQARKGKGSIPEQFHATWAEVERRGGQVVTVYVDVCPAPSRNRLAFNVLLEDLRAGRIALLGCWHSSRLVRSQLAAGEIEEAIEKLNPPLEMFSITDTLDIDVLGILAWAGRWERKAIRERSLAGRQNAAAEGRIPSCHPPFWIETVRDDNGKPINFRLKPVAEWVRWLALSYADGMGSTEIVNRLNRERVPRASGQTKYGWTRQYLAQVLKYAALKGKWGPFWGHYIDVPAVIDESTWDTIQRRMKENDDHQGRPNGHFVALRGLLWCAECGQKMGTHVRDWDYTYKKLKDGTKARYRIKKQELRIRYICGGQQHYGFKCRKPEYIRDQMLFPRVWAKLCEALNNRRLLVAGMESRLKALESADEIVELKRIERRLAKIRDLELSYAQQRAESVIDKSLQQELVMRLNDERKELIQVQTQLADKVKMIAEAQKQVSAAHTLIAALPEVLSNVSRQDQERLIMALITRIDVDHNNEVAITLRLDPDVIQALVQPNRLSASSRQPGSEPSSDSPSAELDNSTSEVPDQQRQQVTAVRCTRSMDYRRR